MGCLAPRYVRATTAHMGTTRNRNTALADPLCEGSATKEDCAIVDLIALLSFPFDSLCQSYSLCVETERILDATDYFFNRRDIAAESAPVARIHPIVAAKFLVHRAVSVRARSVLRFVGILNGHVMHSVPFSAETPQRPPRASCLLAGRCRTWRPLLPRENRRIVRWTHPPPNRVPPILPETPSSHSTDQARWFGLFYLLRYALRCYAGCPPLRQRLVLRHIRVADG